MSSPAPSPTDLLLKVPGSHGDTLLRLVELAPQWGAWWNHHAAWSLVPGGLGLVTYGVRRHHHAGVKHHGSAWRHPWRTWRKKSWWNRQMVRHATPHPPKVLGHNAFPAGDSFTVALTNGATVEQWGKRADNLAVALAVRQVVVEAVPERADHASIHAIREDPFGKPMLSPLYAVTGARPFKNIPVGVDMMGRPVSIDIVGQNMLIGGLQGSGKTVWLRALVAAAVLDPTCTPALFDGKEGVGFAPFRPFSRCYIDQYKDMSPVLDALSSLEREMDRRHRVMTENGWDVWPCHKTGPGKGGPIPIFIDEFATFSVDAPPLVNSRGQEVRSGPIFTTKLQSIVRKGRDVAMPVVLATQRPSVNIVVGDLRDVLGWCYAFACSRAVGSDMILGEGEAKRGFDASKLPGQAAGLGWLAAEKGDPRLVRAYDMPIEQVLKLAALAARVRGIDAPGSTAVEARVSDRPLPRGVGEGVGAKEAGEERDRDNGTEQEKNEGEPGGSLRDLDLEPRDLVVLARLDTPRTVREIMALTDPPLARSRAQALLARLSRNGLLGEPVRRDRAMGNRSPFLYRASEKGAEVVKHLSDQKGDAA